MGREKMYQTAPLLAKLLAKQHQNRYEAKHPGLFKRATFKLNWRAKVGSFPAPNVETLISAGEPAGPWGWQDIEARGDLDQIQTRPENLPLNGYIPGSSIRGIVRAWAEEQPKLRARVDELLGHEDEKGNLISGKVAFLDAWPAEANSPALDIVNPQERFQVYHDSSDKGKLKPLPTYTLGNGYTPISIDIAIYGIPGSGITGKDIDDVWNWVQQALTAHGIGGRTASGYGEMQCDNSANMTAGETGYGLKVLDFTLYSQGTYGAYAPSKNKLGQPELRPSHWRGWLRSWLLRCLLGVMSETDAHRSLGELMGGIDTDGGQSQKGCIRLRLKTNTNQPEISQEKQGNPDFYIWQGQLILSGPNTDLDEIIFPVIRFAASVGGVGRGWRRTLHIFKSSRNNKKYTRGCHLNLHENGQSCLFSINSEVWTRTYENWVAAVKQRWPHANYSPDCRDAEVFSPETCAVYAVPGAETQPVGIEVNSRGSTAHATARPKPPRNRAQKEDPSRKKGHARSHIGWLTTNIGEMRGEGTKLLYLSLDSNPARDYKHNRHLGGDAAQGQNAKSYCSWVSLRRIDISHNDQGKDCQEIVCLFMGESNQIRKQFLQDLRNLTGRTRLFGNPTSV